jgi:hypothetical protein
MVLFGRLRALSTSPEKTAILVTTSAETASVLAVLPVLVGTLRPVSESPSDSECLLLDSLSQLQFCKAWSDEQLINFVLDTLKQCTCLF